MTDRAVSTRPRRHIPPVPFRPAGCSLSSVTARARRPPIGTRPRPPAAPPPPPRSPHASRELLAAAQLADRGGAPWRDGRASSQGSGLRPGRLYRRQGSGARRLSRNIPCRAGSLARATVCNDAVRRRCAVPDRGGGARALARPAGHPPTGQQQQARAWPRPGP